MFVPTVDQGHGHSFHSGSPLGSCAGPDSTARALGGSCRSVGTVNPTHPPSLTQKKLQRRFLMLALSGPQVTLRMVECPLEGGATVWSSVSTPEGRMPARRIYQGGLSS